MIHPERDDWARQLTALRQQMAEQAASLDASGEFPWRNIDHLRAGGWLSLAVPPSCGGAGASLAQLQQVIAAIAWGEPATALIVCMQYLHHMRLAENDAWHAPLRQQVFHDAVEHGGLINSLRVEPELGSPARGGLPDTVATRRAEGWDISGHKIYTTGIEGLRWLAVWARSDDNPPLVGTWLVPGDSPGITVVKSWDHAGMRATGSHEVIFNHVRVAAEHAVDVWPADAPPAAQAEPFRLFANRQTALLAAIYDSIAHYMEIFSDDLTDGGRAAWQALQSALSIWTAAGDGTVYESGGLSLWVPEGWADMAAVTAEDAVWFGESVPGFDVYERLAHISNPDTGLVWNVRALTRAQFQAAFGDADWSEILGASSYVIGSDDAYIYLLSTPTDVQFLVEDPTSMAQYELLRNQSQTVIEGFFFRNGITPNPDCPDADGCYVGPEASGRPEVNEAAKAAVQAAMDGILAPGAFSLTLSPAPGGSGGGSYILPLDMAAAISRMPENFLWYPAEAGSPPAGLASLTLTAEDGSAALQCWEGSSLVRCTRSGVTQWFYAPPVTADAVFNGTVFAALRQIYDEVEWEALREGIIIPDRGQSHLEIAQAWADADTQPALEVTDGSIFACTYVRTVADVDSWADMPETSYPEQSEGHERFWFSYRRIFVPENEAARSWQMAGNTVEYDGRYGEAPEGAYENFQVGVLYLTDEGWRCDGTGTGP